MTRAQLSSERGITLPEVLVTLVIAMILSLATFALVDVTMRRAGEISSRTDGVQRGRLAMDLMTRQLRSQVCLGASAPVSRSVIAGTSTSVTFYVDTGDPSTMQSAVSATATPTPRAIEQRSLTLETTGAYAPGTIVERRWVGTPVPVSTAVPLGYTFPATATSTRELIRPVALTPTPGAESLAPALFRFYKWDISDSAPTPKPNVLLPFGTDGLSADDAKSVARIEITYRATPRKDGRATTVFYNEVLLRTVDPNAETGELAVPCL